MKYRKLRIAWSVAWAVVAVLLCVLWVRSYWRKDMVVHIDNNKTFTAIGSNIGSISFVRMVLSGQGSNFLNWKIVSEEPTNPPPPFPWTWTNRQITLQLPLWAIVAAFGAFAALPWLPFRFSLRTLLIARTLFAVGLGLVVWMV